MSSESMKVFCLHWERSLCLWASHQSHNSGWSAPVYQQFPGMTPRLSGSTHTWLRHQSTLWWKSLENRPITAEMKTGSMIEKEMKCSLKIQPNLLNRNKLLNWSWSMFVICGLTAFSGLDNWQFDISHHYSWILHSSTQETNGSICKIAKCYWGSRLQSN